MEYQWEDAILAYSFKQNKKYLSIIDKKNPNKTGCYSLEKLRINQNVT